MIRIEIPGRHDLELTHALFDFNGTLAIDGALIPGVDHLLSALQQILPCLIVTADTHGTARPMAEALGCDVVIVQSGREKVDLVHQLGSGVVAIGNGYNDIPMMKAAALSIGVLGPEGLSASMLAVADIVVPHITLAIELLVNPKRIVATLRQ